MATAAGVAALVTAAAAVGSSVVQQRRGRQIAKEQRNAQAIETAASRFQQVRQIRQAIARNRVITAQQQAAGFAGGVQGSSAISGNIAALGTDFASSVGAANVQTAALGAQARAATRASELRSRFDPFAAVAGISSQFTNPQVTRSVGNFLGVGQETSTTAGASS